jgi:uncharacterized protein (DUF58 family)
MRFLRARPYEPGEDNPRDIDKFSTPDQYWVNEHEAEVQASIHLLCDMSGSMAFPPKAAVRNLAVLQLTYSLWRASDRVATIFYTRDECREYAERNLKTQLERVSRHLYRDIWGEGTGVFDAVEASGLNHRGRKNDMIFLISDFAPAAETGSEISGRQWRPFLRRLHCDLVPVIISFKLPREVLGSVKLWDPERHAQRLTLLTTRRIDDINEKEKLRVERLVSLFRRLGLDYLVLRQERDVYPQLARLTGLRRRRRS